MKFLRYLALGVFLAGGSCQFQPMQGITPAAAQERNCIKTEELVQLAQANGWTNTTLRGEAMARWIAMSEESGNTLTHAKHDFVVILRSKHSAIVAFGTGDLVCDPIRMPLGLADHMLRPA